MAGALGLAAVSLGLVAVSLGLATGRSHLQDPTPPKENEPWLTFPDDPLGRLWASVGEGTRPRIEPSANASDDDSAEARWGGWADALGQIDGAPDARRAALVQLAHFALHDDRVADAYAWVGALGAGDPEGLAGQIPLLFPGVGPDVTLGPGGRPLPMPAGTVLRPQLPPRSSAAQHGSVENRRATARRLQIGDVVFDMLLKVDGSGVVCDLTHVSGGTVTFALHLPAPAGFRLKSAYIEWEMQDLPEGADPETFDWRTVPLEIVLAPSEDSFTIFARTRRLTVLFPTPPAADQTLPRAMADHGFVLVLREDQDRSPWEAVAQAWSTALGLPVTVLTAADDLEAARAGGASGPTAIRLNTAPDPVALRRLVTSAIEARYRDSR